MRPQVQALISKLRDMKTVQEVGVPEEIIWDMAFYQLHRKGQEVRLAQIAARLTALWVGMVKNEEGKPAYIYGQELAGESANSAGDSPPFESQLTDFLKKSETKDLVSKLIQDHVPGVGRPNWMIKCSCNREYAHYEEWADHLRIRIWRALVDQFPPIGSKEESNG